MDPENERRPSEEEAPHAEVSGGKQDDGSLTDHQPVLNPAGIPDELKQIPRWVSWRWTPPKVPGGKRGKILEVLSKNERVIIEGIKMIKKHTKRNQQYPEGRIIEREGSIHISNVVRAEEFDARAAKRGDAEPAKS